MHHSATLVDANGDDSKVMHHRECALWLYLVYFVGTPIFIDKMLIISMRFTLDDIAFYSIWLACGSCMMYLYMHERVMRSSSF